MSDDDLEYYGRRRDQELHLAEAATSPEAASAHRALSSIYSEEVRRLMPREARLRIVPSERPALLRRRG